MKKVLITPEYESCRTYLSDVDKHFGEGEELFHNRRNAICLLRSEGQTFCVKRYGVPHGLRRVIYSFFRSPKGLRAYRYPQVLLERGFETPRPVAYVEFRTPQHLLGETYFVSTYCPYQHRFYEFGDANAEEHREIIAAFARYAARLHEAGILHLDFSPGNILWDKLEDDYHFSLVDTNRMRFGRVSVEKGCKNFARLWGQLGFFRILASEYASARGASADECFAWMRKARAKFWHRFSKRHKVKYKLEY